MTFLSSFDAVTRLGKCLLASVALAGLMVAPTNAADNPQAELKVAAKSGDVRLLATALNGGADASLRDEDGYDALDYAIERRRYEASLVLLRGAVLQTAKNEAERAHFLELLRGQDSVESSAPAAVSVGLLRLAASQGDVPAVLARLTVGLDADAGADTGYTALALAARWNRLEVVDVLLRHGANANAHTKTCYQTTPLMEASRDGSIAIAKRLIEAGAKVNEPDRYGDHALNWAAFFGRTEFVQLMLSHGADLLRTGQSDDRPIEIAIREKHAGVVALLRAAGATPRTGKGQAAD